MSFIVYFAVAFALSFIGTVPIGLISLTITQHTILNGRRSGILIALGATVMEFIYAFIALFSLDFFKQNSEAGDYIKIAATIIFLILGIYYLLKKTADSTAQEVVSKTSDATNSSTPYKYVDFFRGIAVGTMNMLIIPYWVFFGLWLKSNGYSFVDYSYIAIFSLGAAAGALLVFWGYILLSEYVNKKSAEINRYTNKVVGVLFIGLGLFQLWGVIGAGF